MNGGGLILWSATTICEKSKTSWPMAKRQMKDDLENYSPFEYHPISPASLWQESITRNLPWP